MHDTRKVETEGTQIPSARLSGHLRPLTRQTAWRSHAQRRLCESQKHTRDKENIHLLGTCVLFLAHLAGIGIGHTH